MRLKVGDLQDRARALPYDLVLGVGEKFSANSAR